MVGNSKLDFRLARGNVTALFITTLLSDFMCMIKISYYWREMHYLRPLLGGLTNYILVLLIGFPFEMAFMSIWYLIPHIWCRNFENETDYDQLFQQEVFKKIECITPNCLLFRMNLT